MVSHPVQTDITDSKEYEIRSEMNESKESSSRRGMLKYLTLKVEMINH